MKKILLLAIFSIFIVTISLIASDSIQTAEIQTSAECKTCKKAIEKAVNRLDGLVKANLDIKSKILSIKFDNTLVSLDKIRETISNAGYDADTVKADPKAYSKLPECCKVDAHK